jgi:DNA repair exonuclease SbcCD ATPase subunit
MKGLDKDLNETVIKLDALKEELVYAKDVVESYEDELDKYRKNKRAITKFEDLSQVIDESIPVEYPNFDNIESQIEDLRAIISTQTKERQNALTHNQDVGIHNAKVDALMEQKEDFLSRQKVVENDIISVSDRVNNLEILKKAFSTSGIVAFKLENLTKELEVTINRYLSLLSDGQFQVSFRLDKEKLNIIVSNNGIDTPIETVSGGEFSRIQTAILLAIRNLLSKLGGSSVNLLFLDEITGVLDDEGKEKLIEVLSEEEELNVFLISHDFTHPLIDKISITKENNISSIQ